MNDNPQAINAPSIPPGPGHTKSVMFNYRNQLVNVILPDERRRVEAFNPTDPTGNNEAYLGHYAGFAYNQLNTLRHLLKQPISDTAPQSVRETYRRQLKRYTQLTQVCNCKLGMS